MRIAFCFESPENLTEAVKRLANVINDRLELYRAFIDAGAIGVPPACQPAEPADAAASRPGADVLPNAGRAAAVRSFGAEQNAKRTCAACCKSEATWDSKWRC